ncbi:MAG TPA: hypothetical protein VES97_05745 [Solirubrobacteraceae bacterium]|nr:hypothetical protein [Solirubrobacteraceae bacterium]
MRAVNLIPADQRGGSAPGAGRSEGAAYAVLVLVAGLAVLALLYGRANHQISSSRALAATLTAQAQSEQAATSQLAPYTSFIALRQQRQEAVAELIDTRFDWAHALHELGRVLPRNTSISSLTGTVGSASTAAATSPKGSGAAATATVASATPPGAVPIFTLAGCATSQPAVALMLERLRLIDGVSEVTLQSSTKATSSGGGGAAGSGGCTGSDPAFSVQISFDPLPMPASIASASRSSTTAVASSTAPATSTGAAR